MTLQTNATQGLPFSRSVTLICKHLLRRGDMLQICWVLRFPVISPKSVPGQYLPVGSNLSIFGNSSSVNIFQYHSMQYNLSSYNSVVKLPNIQPIKHTALVLDPSQNLTSPSSRRKYFILNGIKLAFNCMTFLRSPISTLFRSLW
jgi:hypothetical protein